MRATTVVNLKGHRDEPEFADGTRDEVVEKYRAYLLGRLDLLALLPSLRGRRLGCWCVPQRCHAEVIAELAGSLTDDANDGR